MPTLSDLLYTYTYEGSEETSNGPTPKQATD